MKKVFISTVVAFSILAAGTAGAADVVYRSNGSSAVDTNLPGVAELEAKRFEGIHFGAHAGGLKGNTRDIANRNASEKDLRGAAGGVSLGARKQLDNGVVVGVVGDVTVGGAKKSWGGSNKYDPYYGKDKVNGSVSLRGIVGYTPDNKTLIYGTGGAVLAHTTHTLGCDRGRVVATNGCKSQFETSKDRIVPGLTVGAGLEHAINDKVSIYTEYRYTKYFDSKVTLVDPNYPALSGRKFKSDDHSVWVGLNVKF